MQLAAPQRRDGQGTAVQVLYEPLVFQGDLQDRPAQRAADVGAALTPVNAGVRKPPAQRAHGVYIDPQRAQRLRAFLGQVVAVLVGIFYYEPVQLLEPVAE